MKCTCVRIYLVLLCCCAVLLSGTKIVLRLVRITPVWAAHTHGQCIVVAEICSNILIHSHVPVHGPILNFNVFFFHFAPQFNSPHTLSFCYTHLSRVGLVLFAMHRHHCLPPPMHKETYVPHIVGTHAHTNTIRSFVDGIQKQILNNELKSLIALLLKLIGFGLAFQGLFEYNGTNGNT